MRGEQEREDEAAERELGKGSCRRPPRGEPAWWPIRARSPSSARPLNLRGVLPAPPARGGAPALTRAGCGPDG